MLSVYQVSSSRGLTIVNPADLPPDWFMDDVVRWVRMTSHDRKDLGAILGDVELPDEFLEIASMAVIRIRNI